MKQELIGKLEFDGFMSYDGGNVCFPVLYDDESKKSLFDAAELFDSKIVKITIEEMPRGKIKHSKKHKQVL